ncbi:ORF6N domain-containing protein [Escherichia coli]|nr:ORF6N domain-containing protein [Escherichia coli]
MTTQVSVETLSPITHNQLPVVTTELLAKLYGCSVECIHRNHHRNKERFAEGKHYIIAKGADLQNLKISLRDFQTIAPNDRPKCPKAHTLDRTRSSPSRQNARNRSGVGSIRKTGRLLFQPKTTTSGTKHIYRK